VADFCHDQATGLRRLFSGRRSKMLTFAAGTAGVGKTTLLANIAVALARQGQDVLVVDENAGQNLSAFFDQYPACALWEAFNQQRPLSDALFSPAPGVRVLAAAGQVGEIAPLESEINRGFAADIHELVASADTLLIDSAAMRAKPREDDIAYSPWAQAAEIVMVVSGAPVAITGAYTLIRQMGLSTEISMPNTRRNFHILVNRVKSITEGRLIFGNLKKLATEQGVARLAFGGAVLFDQTLRQLGQIGQPIVDALPEHPTAQALKNIADHLEGNAGSHTRRGKPIYPDGEIEQFVAHLLHSAPIATPRFA
jgi:flagellar biosynthesis protein FlhG